MLIYTLWYFMVGKNSKFHINNTIELHNIYVHNHARKTNYYVIVTTYHNVIYQI